MTVKIEIFGDTAYETLSELRGLAEGLFSSTALTSVASVNGTAGRVSTGPSPDATQSEPAADIVASQQADIEQARAATRERGKPAPGRTRRTKEEIAEDEAAEKGTLIETPEQLDKWAEAQGISTGDERVGPEDNADTAAQDKADEQAEVEANRKDLTVDDVKNSFTGYLNKHGMAAVKDDGPLILLDVLGAPPEGENFWKATNIPAEKYDKVIAAFEAAATSDKRYTRKGA